MNLIQNQFSKNAKTYSDYNFIQNLVSKELISQISDKPKNILDIGCGTGAIYRNIDWEIENFIGVDFSEKMLETHPKNKNITLFFQDFNNLDIELLKKQRFDRIISSSALQWASNLEQTFYDISKLEIPISFAIFTSGTFKTLHKTAGIKSPLKNIDEVKDVANKYFQADFKILNYKLEFETVLDIFKYIKKSGVSGGKKKLSFQETKKLMKNYPVKYLEFEIILFNNSVSPKKIMNFCD